MNQERNPKHWPDLPSNFAQALPLLQSLPAPSLLIDTLTTWECAQEPDESHIRLRHQLLHWEKQRQQLSNHLPESNEQWENFRRMLLSLLASPLVLLTALAGHLAHLRLFKLMDEAEQQQLAMQTLSVYAPLANRLGLSTWKWEMEDIAFRLSHPQDYSSIAKALASKRTEREAFIAHTISDISALLHAENISVDIAGRPKHIYSIYKKMQRKSLAFEQLYDLHALRLLTHSIEDCYRVLGLLHQHYVPLLSEFDDYIARPKANGYQSIHTIIIGQNGWPVEIQIRTHQMHQLAEEGVAAHWRYKEGAQQDASLTQLVHQLRQSLSGELDAQSFDAWEKELTGKHIFVLTPKGDLLRLIQGATALDVAYLIHTELGHSCRGALVNGVIKPLDEPLSNGDRVEILTQKQGTPNLNWLSGKFLATSRARGKVKAYFNRQAADVHLATGKSQLDRLKSRFRLGNEFVQFLTQRFSFANNDKSSDKSIAIAIGQGRISSEQLSKAVQDYLHPRVQSPISTSTNENTKPQDSSIFVPGIGKVSAHIAQCCAPHPPEPIIGLLTRQHGLRIHRQDCPDLLALPAQTHQRLLKVRWGGIQSAETPLCLEIIAIERDNLLVDLVTCLTKEGVRIGHFQALPGEQANSIRVHLELSVNAEQDWLALMDKIESLSEVLSVTYCLESS